MDDKIFEIHDNDINVNDLIDKIRENIQKRIGAGVYTPDPDLLCRSSIKDANSEPRFTDGFQHDFEFINNNRDIRNYSYHIKSHRPYFGSVLVKGRQMVHGEIRRYVDPIISHQTEFNEHSVNILNLILKRLEVMETEYAHQTEFNEHSANIQDLILKRLEVMETEYAHQTEFNEHSANIQDSILKRLEVMETEYARQVIFINQMNEEFKTKVFEYVDQTKGDLQKKIEQFSIKDREYLEQSQTQMQNELVSILDELWNKLYTKIGNDIRVFLSQINSDLENKAWLANLLDSSIDTAINEIELHTSVLEKHEEPFNYSRFTEEIGKTWNQESGPSINEPNIFEDSIKIFKNCNNVIDIGCGKGYFLELLKNHHIGGYGIDINSDFVQYCQENGLTVHNVDAITHLKSLEDNTLDGIFICQLIEHLDPASLYLLLKLCYLKIKSGSNVIISTPNISSVQVSSNLFYLDPTHKTHVHPEVLNFLFRSSGFHEIQVKYYQPVSDDFKLKTFNKKSMNNTNQELIDIFNYNIEHLNNSLFGARDYAIIGKK